MNNKTYNTIETLRRTMFRIQHNMNEQDSNTLMNAIIVLGKNQFNDDLGEVKLATTEERGEEERSWVEITTTQKETIRDYHDWLSFDNNRTGDKTKGYRHSVPSQQVNALGNFIQHA